MTLRAALILALLGSVSSVYAAEMPEKMQISFQKIWADLEEQPPRSAGWSDLQKLRYLLYQDMLKHIEGSYLGSLAEIVPAEDLKIIAAWPETDQRLYAQYLVGAADRNRETVPGAPSESDIVKRFSAEDRVIFAAMLSHGREALIESRSAAYAVEFGVAGVVRVPIAPPAPPSNTQKAVVTVEGAELLRSALAAYDDGSLPSSNAIDLFTEYLENYPRTPFKPVIHVRIGNLYGTHRRKGEDRDWEKTKRHYEEAHKLYGRLYSGEHATIWGTLVNRSPDSVEAYSEYLMWLLYIRESGTKDDKYLIRTMVGTLRGYSPRLTPAEAERAMKNHQRPHYGAAAYLRSGTANLFSRIKRSKNDLQEIARRFKGKDIGRKAQEILDKNFPDAEISSDLASETPPAKRSTEESAPKVESSEATDANEGTDPPALPVAFFVIGAVLLVSVVGWALLRRRRR